MTTAKWAMLVYGVAMIGMGLEAYLRVDSVMSLVGGGAIGLLVLVGLAMALKMKTPRWGYILGVFMGLVSLGRFLPSYFKKGDVYPSLVIVLMSALFLGILVGGHLAAQKKSVA